MKLTSGYAPTTYMKPCLIVDTEFNSVTKETAVLFVEALNLYHAYAFGGDHAPPHSEWVVIQEHETEEAAIAFHLDLVRPFKNGGSNEEWEEGMKPYLDLYERWCPDDFGDRRTSRPRAAAPEGVPTPDATNSKTDSEAPRDGAGARP